MKKILFVVAAMAAFLSCTPEYEEGKVSYEVWYDCIGQGTPDRTGAQNEFTFSDNPDFDTDSCLAVFRSKLSVDAGKEYIFHLSAIGDAVLRVDGEPLIEMNDVRGEYHSGKIVLKAGRHDLDVECHTGGDKKLRLLVGDGDNVPHIYNDEGLLPELPDFVMAQASETFARYNEWKGTDEVLSFPVLTDLHTQENYTYQHIGYIVRTDDLFKYDFMVSLGDIGLNLGPAHYSKDYVASIIKATRTEMDRFQGVFLYAAGNHDWDAGEGDYNTAGFLSDTFQKPSLKYAGNNLHLIPGKVYCYYDVPGKDVRVIMLNSEGTGTRNGSYYVYDDEQFEWLRDLLENTPEDMAVVVMSHYMPHPIGRWHNEPVPETKASNERMMDLLAEFKAKRNIVGLFCGDSHVNALEVRDGVNYYITQSYGWCSTDLMMEGTKHAFYDYRKNLCCDVVAIKPLKREVHTFRIGAGGAEYDYAFTY